MKKLTLSILSSIFIMLLIVFTISTDNLNANTQYAGVECNCGLIWGDGCSAANYGNSCAPDEATDCNEYKGNCEPVVE